MSHPDFDVFISYAHQDKAVADATCAVLESKSLRCWVAPRDIAPGREWAEAIVDGIAQSRLMVVVFSASSNISQQVRREVERATARGIPILPFRIEDVPYSKALQYFVGCQHWLDAFTPPLEAHLDALATTIGSLLSGAPEPRRSTGSAGGLVVRASAALFGRRVRPVVFMTLALVALTGIAGFVAYSLRQRARNAPDQAIAARARAEASARQLDAISRGVGFDADLDDVAVRVREATLQFEQGAFERAASEFDAVVTDVDAVLARDRDRTAALGASSRYSSNRWIGDRSEDADRLAAEAKIDFDAGRHSDATAKWNAASEARAAASRESQARADAGQYLERLRTLRLWVDDPSIDREIEAMGAAIAAGSGESSAKAAWESAVRRHGPRIQILAFRFGVAIGDLHFYSMVFDNEAALRAKSAKLARPPLDFEADLRARRILDALYSEGIKDDTSRKALQSLRTAFLARRDCGKAVNEVQAASFSLDREIATPWFQFGRVLRRFRMLADPPEPFPSGGYRADVRGYSSDEFLRVANALNLSGASRAHIEAVADCCKAGDHKGAAAAAIAFIDLARSAKTVTELQR